MRATSRRQRDRVAVQLTGGDRAERGRPHEPDGQPGSDRHDEPRPPARRRSRAGRSCTRASRASRGGGSRLDEAVYGSASETNHRNRELARALDARDRLGCDPIEAVDLYTRQCSLSVTALDLAVDGGDPRRRRRQPPDPRAGRLRRDLSARARGDDDRRAVRDLRRLALRRRAAGEERHRRRHRHRCPGQGRARDVRAPAGRGGEQRQGPARRTVPVEGARPRPVRLGARPGALGESRDVARGPSCSSSPRRSRSPSCRRPSPTSPTRRRSRRSSRPSSASSSRRRSAGRESPTSRWTSMRSSAIRRSPSGAPGTPSTS